MLNLPAVTECYKTYDDINLVKVGDVGRVLVVGAILPEETRGEARNGVTPPLRNARERVFRQPIGVPPEAVKNVETQLLQVLHVSIRVHCCCAACRVLAFTAA